MAEVVGRVSRTFVPLHLNRRTSPNKAKRIPCIGYQCWFSWRTWPRVPALPCVGNTSLRRYKQRVVCLLPHGTRRYCIGQFPVGAAWASPDIRAIVQGAAHVDLGFQCHFPRRDDAALPQYSPGVVTGLFLLLPASGYMYLESVQRELLTKTQIAMAIGIAAVVQIAVVASLYLRMDIDWRMRRLNRPEAL